MNRMTVWIPIKTTNRQSNKGDTFRYVIKLLLFDKKTTCLQAQTSHPFSSISRIMHGKSVDNEKRLKISCAPFRIKLQECVSVDNVCTMYTNVNSHCSVTRYSNMLVLKLDVFVSLKEKKICVFILEIGSNYNIEHLSLFLSIISSHQIIPIYFIVIFRQQRFTSNGSFAGNWPQFVQFMLFYL